MRKKYTQVYYNKTKSRMWKLVRKYKIKRTFKQQSQINKLGNLLNKMDDWRYKKEGRNFK